MTEEIIKHPKKAKPFSRKHMMNVAKIVRNSPMATTSRTGLARNLANYFEGVDPFFDRKTFIQLTLGIIESDPRTENR